MSRATASCPICGKTATREHTPFCSQGCRDRDLLQWLGEGYRLPGRSADVEVASGADGLDSDGDTAL